MQVLLRLLKSLLAIISVRATFTWSLRGLSLITLCSTIKASSIASFWGWLPNTLYDRFRLTFLPWHSVERFLFLFFHFNFLLPWLVFVTCIDDEGWIDFNGWNRRCISLRKVVTNQVANIVQLTMISTGSILIIIICQLYQEWLVGLHFIHRVIILI